MDDSPCRKALLDLWGDLDVKRLSFYYLKQIYKLHNPSKWAYDWGFQIMDIYNDAWIKLLTIDDGMVFANKAGLAAYLGKTMGSILIDKIDHKNQQQESIYTFPGSDDQYDRDGEGQGELPKWGQSVNFPETKPNTEEKIIEEELKAERLARIEKISEKLGSLPEHYKKALLLTQYCDFSYSDATTKMNCSVKDITNWVYRAKKKLKKLVEEN